MKSVVLIFILVSLAKRSHFQTLKKVYKYLMIDSILIIDRIFIKFSRSGIPEILDQMTEYLRKLTPSSTTFVNLTKADL